MRCAKKLYHPRRGAFGNNNRRLTVKPLVIGIECATHNMILSLGNYKIICVSVCLSVLFLLISLSVFVSVCLSLHSYVYIFPFSEEKIQVILKGAGGGGGG